MMRIIALLLVLLASPASAQIVNTLPFQLQNGTTADATQVMADFNQIVNNTNANAAKNGANSDITSISGLTTPLTPAQGGTTVYVGGTSTGTANAQAVATVSPTGFTLVAGKRVVFLAGFTNTGAATLNTASTGATSVFKLTPSGSSALTGGEIVSGSIVEAVYDGTQYQLITNNLSVLGPLTSLASATTTDLGTISSHNVNVTVSASPITSFGSTASTSYPIYYLKFAGAVTMTYNASSLILPGTADITTATNDFAVALYLGSGNWQILSYQRASGASVVGAASVGGYTNLILTNNSGTPNTQINITANAVVLINSSGVPIYSASLSCTINATVNGANGLDAGSLAGSTWYNTFAISNGSSTACLASLSATAPTMPSGYTYKFRLGAMVTDSSNNFMRTIQRDRFAQYVITAATNTTVYPVIKTNTSAGSAAAYSVSSVVPPTASQIATVLSVGSGTYALIGPNTTTNANIMVRAASTGGENQSISSTILLEATTISYGANSNGNYVAASGWTDNL